MWAFCVQYLDDGPWIPLGSDYTLLLRSKSKKGWLRETQQMRKMGSVYLISKFTSKMGEMSNKAFAEYVVKNGNKLC